MPYHKPAHSYDEIVRQTVPEPDSSWRPSPDQEKAAFEHTRILDEDEQKLYGRVIDALLGLTDIDPSGITVEVNNDCVKLYGRVAFASALDRIETRVHGVDGVRTVANYLVVGSA